MTSAGGMFFEGMKKQSMTFTGMVSTMKDSFKMLLVDVGTAMLPTFKLIIDTITKLLDGPLKEFIMILTSALSPILTLIVSLLNPILEALNPVLKIAVSIIEILVKILTTLLIPAIEMIWPIFALFGEILNIILDVLEALMPIFQMIGFFFKFFAEILNLLLFVLRPFLGTLGKLVYIFGRLLLPVLKLFMFFMEPVMWILEKLGPLFAYLGDALEGVLGLFVAMTLPLQWMAEKLSWLIDGLKNVFGWLAELVGLDSEPPSVAKNLESGTLENRTSNITMNNNIAMQTAAGPTGGLGEAAKSIFTLELQKILVNSGY
jgi:hypothetical protein